MSKDPETGLDIDRGVADVHYRDTMNVEDGNAFMNAMIKEVVD